MKFYNFTVYAKSFPLHTEKCMHKKFHLIHKKFALCEYYSIIYDYFVFQKK